MSVLDDVNHTGKTSGKKVAYDTGAATNAAQPLENRLPEGPVTLAIGEAVSSVVRVDGTYGTSTPIMEVSDAGEVTWTNPRDWTLDPSALPDETQVIKVTYLDLVGNEGSLDLQVSTKSQAKVDNEVRVRPAMEGLVPSRDLIFYGKTTAWETSTLNIGGRTYEVKVDGATPYADEEHDWQLTVREEDLNFVVGEPTTITMSYDHLEGGEASITVTYDDKVQKPSIGGGLVVGSRAFWGFLEASSTPAYIDIQHGDDPNDRTSVMTENFGQDTPGFVQINFMGYFYVSLPVALQSGDKVIMAVTDFSGNYETYEFDVQSDAPMQPFAELLGADILGPASGNKKDDSSPMAHRYATPIDLGKLADGQASARMPILIDKGIELGTANFTLSDGMLVMNYDITNPQLLADGAQLRVETYDGKPSIADVLTISYTAATDLASAPSGSVAIADVSNFSKIWLSAQIDVSFPDTATYIEMTEPSQGNANFYRWLSEQNQTAGILNSIPYSSLGSYAKNVEYYKLYRNFQAS